jgi:hypothetical protein
MAKAANKAGKCRLTYRPTECRRKYRWKYRAHGQPLLLEVLQKWSVEDIILALATRHLMEDR